MRSICSLKCTGHTSWLSTTARKAILVTSLAFKFGIKILPIKWYKNEDKLVNMICGIYMCIPNRSVQQMILLITCIHPIFYGTACICITIWISFPSLKSTAFSRHSVGIPSLWSTCPGLRGKPWRWWSQSKSVIFGSCFQGLALDISQADSWVLDQLLWDHRNPFGKGVVLESPRSFVLHFVKF